MIDRLESGFWHYANNHTDNDCLHENGTYYSYGQIAQKSLQIASLLQELSKDINVDIVTIMGEKNLTSYAALLGILTAGKTYCPLAVKAPIIRKQEILQQSESSIIIVSKDFFDDLQDLLSHRYTIGNTQSLVIISFDKISDNIKETYPIHDYHDLHETTFAPLTYDAFASIGDKNDNAYLLFTSGTTGKPKGVPVKHRNITGYLANAQKILMIQPSDKLSQIFALGFDFSVHDIFLCFNQGASLYPIPPAAMMAPAQFLQQHQINFFSAVPSTFHLMQKLGLLKEDAFPAIRKTCFGGEALSVDILKAWQKAASNSDIYNFYGPTEASVFVSFYQWQEEKSYKNYASLGKIFDNQHYRIIDADGQQSNQGELYLGGTQVIDGYWKNPEKTQESFVTFADTGKQIWYKTGDIVKKDDDGFLYFVSRADHQIKRDGNRVELEEIAVILRKISGQEMTSAIVIDKNNSQQIFGFIEGDKTLINKRDIINETKKYLPYYMVPDKIIVIAEMPLNQNGKIDRNILKEFHEKTYE